MADAIGLFSNYTITASMNDSGRLVSFSQDWLGVVVTASAVASGASGAFKVQWSNDGLAWFEPAMPDTIGTLTAPGSLVGRFVVKAPYWRLAMTLTGASVTCSASALC
jgi:hypothetical protein